MRHARSGRSCLVSGVAAILISCGLVRVAQPQQGEHHSPQQVESRLRAMEDKLDQLMQMINAKSGTRNVQSPTSLDEKMDRMLAVKKNVVQRMNRVETNYRSGMTTSSGKRVGDEQSNDDSRMPHAHSKAPVGSDDLARRSLNELEALRRAEAAGDVDLALTRMIRWLSLNANTETLRKLSKIENATSSDYLECYRRFLRESVSTTRVPIANGAQDPQVLNDLDAELRRLNRYRVLLESIDDRIDRETPPR